MCVTVANQFSHLASGSGFGLPTVSICATVAKLNSEFTTVSHLKSSFWGLSQVLKVCNCRKFAFANRVSFGFRASRLLRGLRFHLNVCNCRKSVFAPRVWFGFWASKSLHLRNCHKMKFRICDSFAFEKLLLGPIGGAQSV